MLNFERRNSAAISRVRGCNRVVYGSPFWKRIGSDCRDSCGLNRTHFLSASIVQQPVEALELHVLADSPWQRELLDLAKQFA
jgi:hypothetical protein